MPSPQLYSQLATNPIFAFVLATSAPMLVGHCPTSSHSATRRCCQHAQQPVAAASPRSRCIPLSPQGRSKTLKDRHPLVIDLSSPAISLMARASKNRTLITLITLSANTTDGKDPCTAPAAHRPCQPPQTWRAALATCRRSTPHAPYSLPHCPHATPRWRPAIKATLQPHHGVARPLAVGHCT